MGVLRSFLEYHELYLLAGAILTGLGAVGSLVIRALRLAIEIRKDQLTIKSLQLEIADQQRRNAPSVIHVPAPERVAAQERAKIDALLRTVNALAPGILAAAAIALFGLAIWVRMPPPASPAGFYPIQLKLPLFRDMPEYRTLQSIEACFGKWLSTVPSPVPPDDVEEYQAGARKELEHCRRLVLEGQEQIPAAPVESTPKQ